ncbi:MAG: hypothetical protein ACLGHP_04795 [Vicinamibacteria bacterium]
MSRTKRAVHVCRFRGERVANQKPRRGTACELDDYNSRTGKWKPCPRPAVAFVVYAWGGAALCEKHAKEETE